VHIFATKLPIVVEVADVEPTIASHRQQIADMFTDELRRAFDEIGLEWE
jgi:PII-like signaling protein